MIKRRTKERLLAIILAAAMMMPGAAFALDETEGETVTGDIPGIEQQEVIPEMTEETADDQAVQPVYEEDNQDGQDPAESAEPGSDETGIIKDETLDSEIFESETLAEEQPADEEVMPALLENLRITENPMGTVVIKWSAFEGAVYYETASPGVNGGEAVRTETAKCTVTGLGHGTEYDFTVAAYDENGVMLASGAISIRTEPYRIKFKESSVRALANKVVRPKKKLKINLRKLIREPNSGYSVVQGGCTDGKYAYYLMVSSTTQKGRVLKVRIKDNKVIKRSKVLSTWHGNGMAYDSKRKKLVVIAREKRKQELTLIDAGTLKITKQRDVKYKYAIDAGSKKLSKRYKKSGLAAIAYSKKYDCYIALERDYHNLLIFNPNDFQCIGLVYTNIGKTGTFQAMDADDRYVYLLLSYYNEGGVVQPYNKIIALDWNSENLLPVVNRCKSKDPRFVEKAWFCNNDGSGKADANIRIKTKHEAENIYHTTKNGKEHFYLSEYYGHLVYKKVGRKWYQIYKRDNYVYDLGII